jgi:hypothetical protein
VTSRRRTSKGADDGREFGPEHLERDLPVVSDILGQVDRGHPALTELTLDAVTASEGRPQSGE